MYRVLLDTNFLLVPFQFGVDVFAELDRLLDVEYEIIVPAPVVRELERLAGKRGKEARDARSAMELVKGFKVLEMGGDADAALLSLAGGDTVICTNDKLLRERVRQKRAPVIYMRQKGYLALDGNLA